MKKAREGKSVRDECKDTPSGLEVPELQTSGSWRVVRGKRGGKNGSKRYLLWTVVRGRIREQKAVW